MLRSSLSVLVTINIKHANIHIIGVIEEEKKKEPEKISEEMITENIPNLGKKTVIQVQDV